MTKLSKFRPRHAK